MFPHSRDKRFQFLPNRFFYKETQLELFSLGKRNWDDARTHWVAQSYVTVRGRGDGRKVKVFFNEIERKIQKRVMMLSCLMGVYFRTLDCVKMYLFWTITGFYVFRFSVFNGNYWKSNGKYIMHNYKQLCAEI